MTDIVDEQKKEANTPSLDDVMAQLQGLNDKVGGLEAENARLKEFNDKVIEEKRAAKAKADAVIADKEKELLANKSRTNDENDQLIKQYKERAEALEAEINGFKEKEHNNKLNNKAMELAQQLATKNPAKAALLAKEFKARIRLDDDGTLKVLDENGGVTISQVDVLVKELGTKYAFLCDGIESTGGGSHSSAGAQSKKFGEMTEADKAELYRADPNKYRELKNAGQR